ncbi:tetratricopeptide repeat protein [Leifsonia sp. NPDC058292]|uniref:tetratricopeptide repeat protein n=1 Tax=Leifsonia sp. NPDC058292 TaxID=3346428 RepID=UPI0036D9B652
MSDWQHRVDAVWADAGECEPDAVVTAIDALVAERAPTDAVALFEAAGARDFAGRETEAEPLYRRALETGLPEPQRAQAVIQLASTLRNLGRAGESVALLREELAAHPEHPLSGAAQAFLALALHDTGDSTGALHAALRVAASGLPQYGRAVASYADDLTTR